MTLAEARDEIRRLTQENKAYYDEIRELAAKNAKLRRVASRVISERERLKLALETSKEECQILASVKNEGKTA